MGRADIALRHVTHQYPEDLARALLPPGLLFEVAGWFDSQLTMLEIYKLSPTLRAAFEEGERKGEQRGELKLLSEAFAEQTGRAPTPDEQAALAKRAQEIGAKQALRALFKLHGDALVAWLLGNGA